MKQRRQWIVTFVLIGSLAGAASSSFGSDKSEKEVTALSVEEVYRKATILAVEGKYEQAIPYYERLVELSNWDPGCHGGRMHAGVLPDLGGALFLAKRYEDGLKVLRQANERYRICVARGWDRDVSLLLDNRIHTFGCLLGTKKKHEAKKVLAEIDDLMAEYDGARLESFRKWRRLDHVIAFGPVE